MEYINQTVNIYNTNPESMGALMYNEENYTNQSQPGSMKVTYWFPSQSMDDAKIKQEINAILTGELKEQLRKRTS